MGDTRFDGMENARITLSKFPAAAFADFDVLNRKDWAKLKQKGVRDVLSFDFDDVPIEESSGMALSFSEATGLPLDGFHSQHTGGGLHFHIPIKDAINLDDYKIVCDATYKKMYKRVADALKMKSGQRDEHGLQSWARLGRLPLTHNVKPNRPKTTVAPLTAAKEVTWTWQDATRALAGSKYNVRGLLEREKVRRISMSRPSATGVETPLVGCQIVKDCASDPGGVPEPLWFDLLRILSAAPNGREVAHAVSAPHKDYAVADTDAKFEHAASYKAPTCALMQERHGICTTCPHWRKIVMPSSLLAGDRWKAALDLGFRRVGSDGNVTQTVDLDQLQQYILEQSPGAVAATQDRKNMLLWTGSFWDEVDDLRMMAEWIVPVTGRLAHATVGTLKNFSLQIRTEVAGVSEERLAGKEGHIYFSDAIENIMTGEVVPHSPETSASHVLPVKRGEGETDESRSVWERYLSDLLGDGPEGGAREMVLQEHVGNIIAGSLPRGSNRALYVYGETRNGKSEFVRILCGLMHPSQTSAVSISKLSEKTVWRLRRSLLALDSDASTAHRSIYVRDDSILKKLITGDKLESKKLYADETDCILKTKLVVLSNSLPTSVDKSSGFYRRFSLLRFPNYFPEGLGKQGDLADRILATCRPTIYRWAIEGYRRLITNDGQFSVGPDQETLMKETKEANDPVYAFLSQSCEILDDRHPEWAGTESPGAPVGRLYIMFLAWLQQEGLKTYSCSKNLFSRRVRLHLHAARPEWQAANPAVKVTSTPDGKSVRCFVGIREKSHRTA